MEMLALFVGQASRAMGYQRDENGYWLAQKHSRSQARDRVYYIRLRQPAVKHCLVKNGEPAKAVLPTKTGGRLKPCANSRFCFRGINLLVSDI